MATDAQILANRANAALSTGPVTPEGKAAAARNSLSHGLSSNKFNVLPGENPDDFQALLDGLTQEYRPATPTEVFLVEEAARAQWKLNRIYLLERDILSPDLDSDAPRSALAQAFSRDCAGPQLLLKLSRFEQSARRAWLKALEILLDLRAIKDNARRLKQVEEQRQAARQARDAEAALAGLVTAPVPELPRRQPAPAAQSYRTKPMPAHLERELAAHRRRDPLFDPAADRSQMSRELQRYYDTIAV